MHEHKEIESTTSCFFHDDNRNNDDCQGIGERIKVCCKGNKPKKGHSKKMHNDANDEKVQLQVWVQKSFLKMTLFSSTGRLQRQPKRSVDEVQLTINIVNRGITRESLLFRKRWTFITRIKRRHHLALTSRDSSRKRLLWERNFRQRRHCKEDMQRELLSLPAFLLFFSGNWSIESLCWLEPYVLLCFLFFQKQRLADLKGNQMNGMKLLGVKEMDDHETHAKENILSILINNS